MYPRSRTGNRRCPSDIRILGMVKQTKYFESVRRRPDRAGIQDAWLEQAILHPVRRTRQADGRIRHWYRVPEKENRILRVILLEDGETVHNAFFDRNFQP